MKYLYAFAAVTFILAASSQAQSWRAQFITEDMPFTNGCNSDLPLNNHDLAFVYLDMDYDGPDDTDVPPWCLIIDGAFCTMEAPGFNYRNFVLNADGTMHSPWFEGGENVDPPHGPLHVYLRIFIGSNLDSCLTSPVIVIPNNGDSTTAVTSRSEWTCGVADVSPPNCYGDRVLIEFGWPETPRRVCMTTCVGGYCEVAVGHTNSFRPPVVRFTAGCDTFCEPALAPWLRAGSWDPLNSWLWTAKFNGRDVGCITASLLDSIPCARLDTLTATVSGSRVTFWWNTSWEDAIDSFQVWQQFGWTRSAAQIASVLASGNLGGSQYVFAYDSAFGTGDIAYFLLSMIASDSQRYGAARIQVQRTEDASPNPSPAHPEFQLAPAHPNPFNPTTNISLSVPNTTHTTITIFDITGRKVEDLFNGQLKRGEHNFTFNGSNLATGLYFARVHSGEFFGTQKLLLLK